MCGSCRRAATFCHMVFLMFRFIPAFSLSAILLCHLLVGCFTVTLWQPQLRTLHLHVITVKGEQQGELGGPVPFT